MNRGLDKLRLRLSEYPDSHPSHSAATQYRRSLAEVSRAELRKCLPSLSARRSRLAVLPAHRRMSQPHQKPDR